VIFALVVVDCQMDGAVIGDLAAAVVCECQLNAHMAVI